MSEKRKKTEKRAENVRRVTNACAYCKHLKMTGGNGNCQLLNGPHFSWENDGPQESEYAMTCDSFRKRFANQGTEVGNE